MDMADVEAFFTMLTDERKVAAYGSTSPLDTWLQTGR
jgi:hypothetical protein